MAERLYCLVSMTVPDSDPVQLTVANVPVMTVPLTVAFMVYEHRSGSDCERVPWSAIPFAVPLNAPLVVSGGSVG